jgi:F-type H+-transporting ATPase subunit delta
MRGVSARAFEAAAERLEAAISDDGKPMQLGDDLFAVAALLDAQPGLRRAFTDPAGHAEAKQGLAGALLADKVSEPAVEVFKAAVAHRWSSSHDLGDAIEQLGVIALAAAADDAGHLDDLEDELFRFSRVVQGEPALRDALSDRSVPVDHRRELVRQLLAKKASKPAVRLAEQALVGRHRSVGTALADYQRIAAERRSRVVATVRSAVALTDEEKARLAEVLGHQAGREVHLNVIVDPGVIGGVRVELGDDVIDGTVVGRLEDARRRMAG